MGRTIKGIVVAASLAAAVLGGARMADAGPMVVASAMAGRLVDASGRPQEGLAVTRRWSMAGDEGEQTVVSDAQGNFAFSEVTRRRGLMRRLLPTNPSVNHAYTLPDRGLTLMEFQKTNFARDGEWGGRPLRVVCRVDAEPGTDGTFFWGTCRPAG